MSQYGRSLSVALDFIDQYDGSSPLNVYLKKRFKGHKNFGSKDRKRYADLVYSWFRTGLWKIDDPSFKLNISALLMQLDLKYPGLMELNDFPVLLQCADLPDLSTRMDFLAEHRVLPSFKDIFPLAEHARWSHNQDISLFFQVPDTWLRIWKGTAPDDLHYEIDEESRLQAYHVPQGIDLESFAQSKEINIEVQDFASQIAASGIIINKDDLVWDCCAGAGGKSLYLSDAAKVPFQLYASDLRDEILQELNRRFESRKQKPKTFLYDLASSGPIPPDFPESGFDVVVADVPCSGSGTWFRTPEQLSFFTQELLDEYVHKQRFIIEHALVRLKPGGRLNYITCSCYTEENEEQIDWMIKNLPLQLNRQRFIDKRDQGADAMFFAELIKVSR